MPRLVVPSHLLTQKNRQNCGGIEIKFVYLQQEVGLRKVGAMVGIIKRLKIRVI